MLPKACALALVVAAMLLTACTGGPSPVATARLSPSASPVTLSWAYFTPHQPPAHIYFQARASEGIKPTQIRLVDSTGQAVASAPAQPIDTPFFFCRAWERGSVVADVQVSYNVLQGRRQSAYRVEALVGETWMPARAVDSGCAATE